MSAKNIIVKVANEGVYFNPGLCLPLNLTNLPYNDLRFQTHVDIFWQLEMISYTADNKCLKVRVSDYQSTEISVFDKQSPKSDIRMLLFEKLDFVSISPDLSYFQKINLNEAMENLDRNPFSGLAERPVHDASVKANSILTLGTDDENVFTESFDVHFSDAHIHAGYISFKHRVERLGEEVEFKIVNGFLLPEFELIKFWFAKKLKTRKFRVYARITLFNNKLEKTDASSKDIYKINENLIESIKYQRTLGFSKKINAHGVDKSLFSNGEIFDMFDDEEGAGNVFNQSETDILKYFMEHSSVRNRQQLSYLAGKMQSDKYKLKFTLHPDFGFLFLIEGARYNHFVWELLNSNATYVWSFVNMVEDVPGMFLKIEEIINIIRSNGRDNYRRDYRKNPVDESIIFKMIPHENIGSNMMDHFPKWKNRLEEQIM